MSATHTPATVELALVSHTNAGKTTLARTLLGREIGEVRDAPHVTELAQAHTLLETPGGDVLRLWDTPGFGDSARLVKRLRAADNPIGWLMREVWDRYRNRPLWCSQQAVRTVRESADVVLYLVNAAEDP
ncbi:MAG: GTPase domain-containing protein, partial [Burkholderiales bacterium]